MSSNYICIVTPFTYTYQGGSFNSVAKTYIDKGELRYLVVLPEGVEIGIAPLAYPDSHDKILWAQATRLDEMMLPYDMIQAMGEGLEKSMDI